MIATIEGVFSSDAFTTGCICDAIVGSVLKTNGVGEDP